MIRVLVTGVGSGGHGEQIVKALAQKPPGGYRVFGADANPGLGPKDLLGGEIHQLPWASDKNYLLELLKLCKLLRIDAVFHGSEPELKILANNRQILEDAGIKIIINETEIINLSLDKNLLSEHLRNLGFGVPKSAKVLASKDFDQIDWFPVIVKPSRGGGGSRDVYVVQNREELVSLSRLIHLESENVPWIVQEYLGTEFEEFTVGVLHDSQGKLMGSIGMNRDLTPTLSVRTRVRNRSARKDLGDFLVISSGVSQGKIGAFPEVTSQCEDIAQALGSRGPLNIQCRFVSGRVMVFEVNPRFSGTTSARALAGFNEPQLFLDEVFGGEKPGRPKIKEGFVTRRLTETFEPLEEVS